MRRSLEEYVMDTGSGHRVIAVESKDGIVEVTTEVFTEMLLALGWRALWGGEQTQNDERPDHNACPDHGVWCEHSVKTVDGTLDC